eukprot:4676885-Prymnesium_polylepis.1
MACPGGAATSCREGLAHCLECLRLLTGQRLTAQAHMRHVFLKRKKGENTTQLTNKSASMSASPPPSSVRGPWSDCATPRVRAAPRTPHGARPAAGGGGATRDGVQSYILHGSCTPPEVEPQPRRREACATARTRQGRDMPNSTDV